MTQPVIRTAGLGKRYRLGELHSFGSLREALVRRVRTIGRSAATEEQSIWALRDVDLEIAPGEAVGIIGRNGAGKSTLLKVLSRITEPTTGRAEIRGRVGSLLEVGTGFHPELTGRENIYLNGAILGMRRAEIAAKFDEIVAFAEVERFIDTPIKRYSSGMQVRLAFSVAAHLEPDILLVDEVLAVGDLRFQKRCLGRMSEVATSGRTVLFVSHNLAAVKRLCARGILIESGSVRRDGLIEPVIRDYSEMQVESVDGISRGRAEFRPDPAKPMQILSVGVFDDNDRGFVNEIDVTSAIVVRIEYLVRDPIQSAYIMCAVQDAAGIDVIWTYDGDSDQFGHRDTGQFTAQFRIPEGILVPGRYSVRVAVVDTNRGAVDYPGRGPSFFVSDTDSLLAHRGVPWPGVVRVNPPWTTRRVG